MEEKRTFFKQHVNSASELRLLLPHPSILLGIQNSMLTSNFLCNSSRWRNLWPSEHVKVLQIKLIYVVEYYVLTHLQCPYYNFSNPPSRFQCLYLLYIASWLSKTMSIKIIELKGKLTRPMSPPVIHHKHCMKGRRQNKQQSRPSALVDGWCFCIKEDVRHSHI